MAASLMAEWLVAASLNQLLSQLNTLAPNRSRASDGSIGDEDHKKQGSASDHNPWYVLAGQPLVTARDFTHDPAGGLDCDKLAAALIEAKDIRVKYLIWRGRLMDARAVPGNGFRPWTWQPSSGHHQHLHLSVMANASAGDPRSWSLPGLSTQEEEMGLTPGEAGTLIEVRDNLRRLHDNLILGDRRKDRINIDLGYIRDTILTDVNGLKGAVGELRVRLDSLAGQLGDDEAKLLSAIRAQPTGGQVDVAELAAALAQLLPQDVTPDQIQDALRSVLRTGVDHEEN